MTRTGAQRSNAPGYTSVRWTSVMSWAVAIALHVLALYWLSIGHSADPVSPAGATSVVFVDLAPPTIEPAASRPMRADEPTEQVSPMPAKPVELSPAAPNAVSEPAIEAANSLALSTSDLESISEAAVDTPTTTPSVANPDADRTAGDDTATSPPADAAAALARWQAELLAHLGEHHRYPFRARRLRIEGVTQLRFTVNRAGDVVRFDIAGSSGHALLDEESLALIQRAQPLPSPPDDVIGDAIEVVVPVTFELRHR